MLESKESIEQLKSKLLKLEEQNNQLKKRIEQVERERTEYLQNVSHQLVAPLNAIKWHIENLTEARIGIERAKKVLRSVYSQATLVVHLSKNFRLMSNLEADHALTMLKEPLQEIELLRLLINLADDFQPLAWEDEINIIVDKREFDAKPPILAMKPLISQVFSNIIENAVKYSDKGSEIIIRGRYISASDTFAVSIRNRGISLASADIGKVFDRGFRGAEAKRKYPAGTGFGLYIAKRIIEIHEGQISVSTQDGCTIFEVILSGRGLKGKARFRGAKWGHILYCELFCVIGLVEGCRGKDFGKAMTDRDRSRRILGCGGKRTRLIHSSRCDPHTTFKLNWKERHFEGAKRLRNLWIGSRKISPFGRNDKK